MLNLLDLFIDLFAVFVLGPLVLHSLLTGALPPEHMWLGKYYRVERWLLPVGNLFLLTVIANAMLRLGVYFDVLVADQPNWLAPGISWAFFFTLCVYALTWARALRNVSPRKPEAKSI